MFGLSAWHKWADDAKALASGVASPDNIGHLFWELSVRNCFEGRGRNTKHIDINSSVRNDRLAEGKKGGKKIDS
jgi:hypothetical protein